MNSRIYRLLLQYGMAIGSTAVALLLTLLLQPVLNHVISLFFFVAITLTTWYGGIRPGIVAIILSALAINIFLIPPLQNITNISVGDLVRLAVFSLVALMIHQLKSDLQKSQRRVEQLSQQLLKESADRLKVALNAAQMGMWDWDLVTGIITWSPEHEQLFGLPLGSFDGQYETFDACLYPADRENLKRVVDDALKHGIPYHHEFRVVWADGSIHWIEGRGQAFYNQNGQPVRMSGTVMAIDERKQAQLLLNQQLEQQRLVMEIMNRVRKSLNLPEILQTTVDEVRQFLQVDRVIIFQFTPGWGGTVAVESVVDQAFALFPFDIHDPCIGDRYVEPFLQGLVTAKSDIYTADISPCHVEFLAQFQIRANLVVPILKNNELWGLLAVHHCVAPRQWQDSEIDLLRQLASQVSIALQQADLFAQVQAELIERKQVEADLRTAHERMITTWESMTDAYTLLDHDWCIAYANRASMQIMSQLTGLEPKDIPGKLHWDLFPWTIGHTLEQEYRRAITEQVPIYLEFLYEPSNNWFEIHAYPSTAGLSIYYHDITSRKQAEIALKEGESLLRLFIQYAPAGIAMLDQNMCYLMASQQWIDEYDLGLVENLVHQSHYDLFPEIPERWRQIHQRCLAGAIEKCDDDLFVRLDGSQQWVSWEIRPWYTATGEIGGIIIFSVDVTPRKQSEELLRQSEARLRLAQAASNSAVWDWDVQQNSLFWSPEYYQLYALDPTIEPNYENWLSCIHPDDREKANQQTQQALTETSNLRVEFRVRRSDEIRWFAGIGQVFHDKAGQPTRMIGITIDITQPKQTEIALQQLNDELEQRVAERTEELNDLNHRLLSALKDQEQAKQALEDLYNNAPCGYHSLDAEGTIIRMNDTELNWLGYTRDEVINQMKLTDLITPESRQIFYQNFPKFMQQGWVKDVEFQLLHKDGSTRWVNLNATALKDDAGNFVMSRSSIFDISDRKRVEEERKQAEQTLALQAVITRNMAEGICLVKEDATIVYANPKFEQMFGYEPGELNGQNASILNYETPTLTAEASTQSNIKTVLQSCEATYEVYNVKKDGTPFWCRATCSVFNHPDYGNVIVAVQQDITPSKQAEAALQQQAKLETLRWEMTQTIRQSLDLKDILNTATEQLRQTLQVDRVAIYHFQPDWSGDFIAESVSDAWVKLVDSDVQKIWKDTHLQETQGGRFQNHETFVISDIYKTGLASCHIELLEQFQAKAYAVAPIFLRRNLWGLLAIYQNTTARQWQEWEIELLEEIAGQSAIALQQSTLYNELQAELQERERSAAIIQEAERRWRSLLDNVQLIVVELDHLGHINYINPFFLDLTRYSRSEVLGKNWFENFLPTNRQQPVKIIFSEILVHNTHSYVQDRILTKSGEERYISWNNTRLQDISGNIIGTISIGEDITERQKVDQMKQEFISIVSHELRTPLTSIRGSLGLIAGGVYDKKPEKMKEMIEIAARQSDRLVRLVNDILDLRRLESGQSKFKFQHCSAADLIQQSVDVMRSQAEQNQVTLAIIPTTAVIWADADAIVQTLTNLLSNAIKFSPPHSTVTLTAHLDSSSATPHPYTQFSIQDQGRGIPSDQLETIFGQFQQVDVSDSREKGGTGLGLAICRTIVKQHGGKIWVESLLEQGSTFYFTLPSTQPSSDNG